MPGGRPRGSDGYTDQIGAKVCSLVLQNYPVRQIAARKGMPTETTIWRWLAAHDDFREQYARAKELQAERFAEEIVEISDDGTNDWVEREGENGHTITVVDHEHIQRSKLRVDARKWLMSKMAPKKYGDKIEHEVTGKDGGPLETITRIELVPVEPGKDGDG